MKVYSAPGSLKKKIIRIWRNIPEFYAFKVPFDMRSQEKIIFIVGSGRSGTTILKNELASRYHIKFPIELPALGSMIKSYFIWRIFNKNAKFSEIQKYFMSLLVKSYDVNIETRDTKGNNKIYNISNEYNFRKINFNMVGNQNEIGFSHLYIDLLKIVLKINDDDLLGDKTPWNTFHIHKISENFPNALFVHIVRDGREVAASYEKSLGDLMNLSISDGAKRWSDSLRKVNSMKNHLGNRLIELKYEDLVLNPDMILDKLSKRLNLKERTHRIEVNDLDTDIQQHQNLNKNISGTLRGNVSDSIELCDADLQLMRKYLIMYGYLDE